MLTGTLEGARGHLTWHEDGDPEGTPVLLVHGMGSDHTHMDPLRHRFAASHRVVAVDLRGHGTSSKDVDADYGIEVFAEDLTRVIDELDLGGATVVGHSMGGITATCLAHRHPELLTNLVLLDPGIVLPAETTAGLGAFYDNLRGQGYRETLAEFARTSLFLDTDPPEVRDAVADMMSAMPQEVFLAIGDDLVTYDSDAAVEAINIPTLLICPEAPFPDMERLALLAPDWNVGRTVGSGHYIQLIVPDQVWAMIDRFLSLATDGV